MCGRYSLTEALDVIVRHFLIQHVGPEVEAVYGPSYNVAPSQQVLVIGLRQGARAAAMHRWGLIPGWAKDPSIGYKMINARAETVHERPAYRTPFRHRRCLIPADSLYEWKRDGKKKQPYRFLMRDEAPFAFAGLWDEWRAPDGQAIRSCTIITTEPNELIAPVHNRMPVILPPEAYDEWLDPSTEPDRLHALLVPYPADRMKSYPVSTRVNSPANNDPELILPIA